MLIPLTNPNEVPSTKKGLVPSNGSEDKLRQNDGSSSSSAPWALRGGYIWGTRGRLNDHDRSWCLLAKWAWRGYLHCPNLPSHLRVGWPLLIRRRYCSKPKQERNKGFRSRRVLFDALQVVWPLKLKIDIRLCSSCVFPMLVWRLNSNVVQGYIANVSNGNARHVCSKRSVVHSALDMSSTYWVSHVRQMSSICNTVISISSNSKI